MRSEAAFLKPSWFLRKTLPQSPKAGVQEEAQSTVEAKCLIFSRGEQSHVNNFTSEIDASKKNKWLDICFDILPFLGCYHWSDQIEGKPKPNPCRTSTQRNFHVDSESCDESWGQQSTETPSVDAQQCSVKRENLSDGLFVEGSLKLFTSLSKFNHSPLPLQISTQFQA